MDEKPRFAISFSPIPGDENESIHSSPQSYEAGSFNGLAIETSEKSYSGWSDSRSPESAYSYDQSLLSPMTPQHFTTRPVCMYLCGKRRWPSLTVPIAIISNVSLSGTIPPIQKLHPRSFSSQCILSLISTVVSCLLLTVAIRNIEYPFICEHCAVNLTFAKVITAVLQQLFSLSFVAVSVVYLGQRLTMRSRDKSSNGVNLAEMGTKNWIVDPGSTFSDLRSFKIGIKSKAGAFAFVAALVAVTYSLAVSALSM